MKLLEDMVRNVTSSPYYAQMIHFTEPLKEYFGINYFWYYRISNAGRYTYVGTQPKWEEYCLENNLISRFPCLRHPGMLNSGIMLMKNTSNTGFLDVLKAAWEKFGINFNINLSNKTSEGIEAFGFATRYNHPMVDEKLLNELPLLRHFIKIFREKHEKLFQVLYDNQIDLSSCLGPVFNEKEKTFEFSGDRKTFLRRMKFIPNCSFTDREKDVLVFVSKGYPAPYIAQQLNLHTRTVENYIATIKSKLSCDSKVELIQKTQELVSIGCLDFEI